LWNKLSTGIDKASNYFSDRKGLLPLVGLVLILVDQFLVIFFPELTVSVINLFLHLGLVIAILGFLIAAIL
jgi:hypothetical protein